MTLHSLDPAPPAPTVAALHRRVDALLGFIDARLRDVPYLAGAEFTPDVLTVFPFTTMRSFVRLDLQPCAHIASYPRRIEGRPAYQRAMQKDKAARAGSPALVSPPASTQQVFRNAPNSSCNLFDGD